MSPDRPPGPGDATGSPGEPVEGDRVGSYRIDSLLAVGGMGRVYHALGDDGNEVTLKLIKPQLARDQVFRRRFEREVRIAEQIVHPHLVPLVEAGEHNGVPYLAQRFVRGTSLAQKIERGGPLPLAMTLAICTQVAGGLDALHAAELVHRDVKPANILLDQREVAYLTDFGLAKDTRATILTAPGQALGTVDYMAPEQIRSQGIAAATDVYGLGCVMCECISGKPPFADREGLSIMWAHLQDDPPDPCTGRPELPPGLSGAILRALAKWPERRPASAGEYARGLCEAGGDGPRIKGGT
jgi:serine/threonine-protein kinase